MKTVKCSHCHGTGSTEKSCCNDEALGHHSNWMGNHDVVCCACGGKGVVWEPLPRLF